MNFKYSAKLFFNCAKAPSMKQATSFKSVKYAFANTTKFLSAPLAM